MKEFIAQILQPMVTKIICRADSMGTGAPIPFSTPSLLAAEPISSNFLQKLVAFPNLLPSCLFIIQALLYVVPEIPLPPGAAGFR